MTIAQLRQKIADKEKELKEHEGKMVRSSPAGPIGIDLIKALFEVVEQQQRDIDQLKRDKPQTLRG